MPTNTSNMNLVKIEKLRTGLKELPDFCDDFIIGIEQRTSILTRLAYIGDLSIFFDFLVNNIPAFRGSIVKKIHLDDLDAIKSTHIERFLSYLSCYRPSNSPQDVAPIINNEKAKARKLSAIRSLFKFLYNKDLIAQNVASKVEVPKMHTKEIVRLEQNEVVDLFANLESEVKFYNHRQDAYNLNTRDRDLAILTLFLNTGIRVSELVNLDVDDIDLKNLTFVVTRKGGNRCSLFFNQDTVDVIENYLFWRNNRLMQLQIEESALFISLQNKRICVRAVENLVKKIARTVTTLKNISPHKLRSTYGTELYRSTKDIYVVAEVLGHKDVNTTKKHYASLSEDIKRDASTKVNYNIKK